MSEPCERQAARVDAVLSRRRILCLLGWHYWQYLLAPPTWRKGDDYEPGVWCIFCATRHPWRRKAGTNGEG